MSPASPGSWLAALSDQDLAALLRNRYDLLAARSLRELVTGLERTEPAIQVAKALDHDCHLLSQALQVLGGSATRRELADRVHDPGGRFGEALERLLAWGLVWQEPGGRVRAVHSPGLWEHPFGLGPGLSELSPTVEELKPLMRLAGLPVGGRKDAMIRRIVETVSGDPARVRRAAAGLSAPARKLLDEMVRLGPVRPYTPDWSGRRHHPIDQLVKHGLLVNDGWQVCLPRELAVALRGDGWAPTLTGPPEIGCSRVPAAVIAGDAASAALSAVESVTRLLGEGPITRLKNGAIGVREVRRLGKVLACPEAEVALWLDLAYAAGLLGEADSSFAPSAGFDAWLALDLAARWSVLSRRWLSLPQAPTHRARGCCEEHLDVEAPPYPIESDARLFRRTLLNVLAGLPEGAAPSGAQAHADMQAEGRAQAEGLVPALGWWLPFHCEQPLARAFVEAALREAALLGLTARGALTPLGRALAAKEHITETAAAILPAQERTATLLNDLTAVVSGPPAPGLARLLDSCADVEARGSARVWRFTQQSVRRALDTGASPDALIASLEQVAARGLPQPLRYLIGDVARTHGLIQVSAVASVVTAADETTLTELLHSRRLARLRLRRIAPTVAVSSLDERATLALLREAGYAPTGAHADGSPVVETVEALRAPGTPQGMEQIDFVAEAARIRSGQSPARTATSGRGNEALVTWIRRGKPTRHRLREIELSPEELWAWCETCDDQHTISVLEIADIAELP